MEENFAIIDDEEKAERKKAEEDFWNKGRK